MNLKISFKNMDQSAPLEAHATEKLSKILDFFTNAQELNPFNVEVHLKANKLHPHHAADIQLKTPRFKLNAHDEGPDMYVVIDNTVDKLVKLLKKEKNKWQDKVQKADSEKKKFSDDKYKL